MCRLHTENNHETFCKLLISKDGSPVVWIDEEMKRSKIWETLLNSFTIRGTLQENKGVCHVIRDFVGVHRKGL